MSRGVGQFLSAVVVSAAVLSGGQVSAAPITVGAIGDQFTVVFDGRIEGALVNDLSAEATFLVTDFSANSIEFDVTLTNTTGSGGSGLSSRIPSLAFNTTPNLTGATTTGDANDDFDVVIRPGHLPGYGSIETCFVSGPNCSGGGGGGLSSPDSTLFSIVLSFAGPITGFTFDTFAVRYQSITGTSRGTSGIGFGSPYDPPAPVPEPASMLLLGGGLAGLAIRRFRRRA